MWFNYYKYGSDVGQAMRHPPFAGGWDGGVGSEGGTPVNRLSRSAVDGTPMKKTVEVSRFIRLR